MLKPRWQQDARLAPTEFRAALVTWFTKNARDYPWRRTVDPYAILISEVMLQQTQIATVLGRGFYTRFLESFPTVQDLAVAQEDALLKAWEGLGYYRRVRMLRETARAVVNQAGGKFPHELTDLLALPGVGPYTAGALRAFAWNLPAVVVDGNVLRVLARLLDFTDPIDEPVGLKMLWEVAAELADPKNPRLYHAGLMELGQRICRPGVPDCLNCPVAKFCQTAEPENLPIKKRKQTITAVEEHALWVQNPQGQVLLHREAGKRREGLWKLPTRSAREVEGLLVIDSELYTITRYRVQLHVHNAGQTYQAAADESWIDEEAVMSLAMPAPFRRVLGRLLAGK